jgi:hypothetical protein
MARAISFTQASRCVVWQKNLFPVSRDYLEWPREWMASTEQPLKPARLGNFHYVGHRNVNVCRVDEQVCQTVMTTAMKTQAYIGECDTSLGRNRPS